MTPEAGDVVSRAELDPLSRVGRSVDLPKSGLQTRAITARSWSPRRTR